MRAFLKLGSSTRIVHLLESGDDDLFAHYTIGVKQGCSRSLILFGLYGDDVICT